MTIQQLKAFLAVCEDLNYTRAAEKCYISRQALRQNIAALENELCGALFHNVYNHLSLTEKGEKLQREAAPVVEAFDRLEQTMRADIAGNCLLHIGISHSLIPDYLPNLDDYLDAFSLLYPGVSFHKEYCMNDDIVPAIRSGALDCGLQLDLRCGSADIARTELTAHPSAMLLSRRHPLAGKPFLTKEDLPGQTVCLPGQGEEFEPLLSLSNDKNSPICFSTVPSYYQVLYRVCEDNVLALNRYIVREYGKDTRVVNLEMRSFAPLCSAFVYSQKNTAPVLALLRDHLIARIRQDFPTV